MNKKIFTIAMVISLIAGGGMVSFLEAGEQLYFCESTGLVCQGLRLSASGKTCYYLENGEELGKQCRDPPYWQPLSLEDFSLPSSQQDTVRYSCSPKECVRI